MQQGLARRGVVKTATDENGDSPKWRQVKVAKRRIVKTATSQNGDKTTRK